jgi:outer membrane beta-barrel protein
VGVYGGLMSVEDFGTNAVAGVRVAYHVTEDLFVEGVYGRTKLGETSFERLSGGAEILTDDERRMTYYNVSIGYNLFPGESFLTRRSAFRGGLYLIAGGGSTEFGGDDRFTINAGLGYRLAANDWLALHVDVRDHVFKSDLLGTEQTLHNIEFTGGLTVFF